MKIKVLLLLLICVCLLAPGCVTKKVRLAPPITSQIGLLGPGGCTDAAQCNGAGTCTAAVPLWKCCLYPPACWTEVIGLVAPGVSGKIIPMDSVLLNGIGLLLIEPPVIDRSGTKLCEVGEVLLEIDSAKMYDSTQFTDALKGTSATINWKILNRKNQEVRVITTNRIDLPNQD